ncbi:MAG: hypothetical protein V4736_07435 [Bdellovibrionota bacterium]
MSRDTTGFSKKNQREISDFLTQELLYDFYFDSLDAHTKEQLLKKFRDEKELQDEVNRLKLADQYLKQLKKVHIKNHYLVELKNYESIVSAVQRKFRSTRIPAGLKWAIEGTLALVAVLLLLWILPFNHLSQFRWSIDSPTILAKIDKVHKSGSQEKMIEESGPVHGQDDLEPINEIPGKAEIKAESPSLTQTEVPPVKDDSAAAVIAKPKEVEKTVVANSEVQESSPTDAKPSTQAATAQTRGILFRGDLHITGSEATSEQIKAKIEELGGKRAGEVPIGWSKGPGNFYYHFTIPEDKGAEMEEFIRQFGTFKVSQEKHPRKIPVNLRRYIFTLSEKE